MTDELDEALKECGFTINSEGIATSTGTVTVEVANGPMGMFYVRATFDNGKTLHSTFNWDDIEDVFPWKAFVGGRDGADP